MGIKQEENGRYSVSYHKRHPITNKPITLKRINIVSEAKAKRVFGDLVVKVNNKIKEVTAPRWANILDMYKTHLEKTDLRIGTLYKRDKTLRKHTLDSWKNKFVDEITTGEIISLTQKMSGEMAESHRKFIVKGLNGLFDFAVDQNYINRNPMPKVRFKLNEKIKLVLNEDQIQTLLKKSRELDWNWYPHYAVALYTGMRSGELYALTWGKVNIEKRTILVNQSWTEKDGFKSTKSGDDRVIEIPKPLIPLLTELKKTSDIESFVLPRLPGWNKGEQAKYLRCFLTSIGLPPIRFHDLRASWATLLLSKGVAPSKVMSMGGWKDMDTMMIYMRKAGIDIKDSTSVLDNLKI